MGRKNCAVIMLTSACLVLTACAPTEFPEQNGTENQDRMESFVEQELAEFGKDDIEKIPDHLTYQVDDLLTVDADIRLWGAFGMEAFRLVCDRKKLYRIRRRSESVNKGDYAGHGMDL